MPPKTGEVSSGRSCWRAHHEQEAPLDKGAAPALGPARGASVEASGRDRPARPPRLRSRLKPLPRSGRGRGPARVACRGHRQRAVPRRRPRSNAVHHPAVRSRARRAMPVVTDDPRAAVAFLAPTCACAIPPFAPRWRLRRRRRRRGRAVPQMATMGLAFFPGGAAFSPLESPVAPRDRRRPTFRPGPAEHVVLCPTTPVPARARTAGSGGTARVAKRPHARSARRRSGPGCRARAWRGVVGSSAIGRPGLRLGALVSAWPRARHLAGWRWCSANVAEGTIRLAEPDLDRVAASEVHVWVTRTVGLTGVTGRTGFTAARMIQLHAVRHCEFESPAN